MPQYINYNDEFDVEFPGDQGDEEIINQMNALHTSKQQDPGKRFGPWFEGQEGMIPAIAQLVRGMLEGKTSASDVGKGMYTQIKEDLKDFPALIELAITGTNKYSGIAGDTPEALKWRGMTQEKAAQRVAVSLGLSGFGLGRIPGSLPEKGFALGVMGGKSAKGADLIAREFAEQQLTKYEKDYTSKLNEMEYDVKKSTAELTKAHVDLLKEGGGVLEGIPSSLNKAPRQEREKILESISESHNKKVAELEHFMQRESPMYKVWDETGWYKGPDNKWRFEISDKNAKIKGGDIRDPRLGEKYYVLEKIHQENPYGIDVNITSFKAADILEHDALFKAYPGFKDYKIRLVKPQRPSDYNKAKISGQFNEEFKTLDILVPDNANANEYVIMSVLHEFQHAIQSKEGFARGANLNLTKDYLIGTLSDNLDYLLNQFKQSNDPGVKKILVEQIMEEIKYKDILKKMDPDIIYGGSYGELEARMVEFRRLMEQYPPLSSRKGVPPPEDIGKDTWSIHKKVSEGKDVTKKVIVEGHTGNE